MKILHLETSSKNCSVAISDGGELLCLCEEASENYKQSESLHSFVEWALEGAEISLNELDAVSLGMGPGSYTGLRIGASAAKGFCFSLDIPLIAVNSLDLLAAKHTGQGFDLIIPAVDARRMEIYAKICDGATGKEISETKNIILNEESFAEYKDRKIIFTGDGAAKMKEILHLPLAEFDDKSFPSAKYLASLATKKYLANDFEDVAYFEPFYLKEFQGVKKIQQ